MIQIPFRNFLPAVKRLKIYIIVLFCVCGLITSSYYVYQGTRIKKVIIVSDEKNLTGLTQLRAVNFINLNEQEIESSLQSRNIHIKNISVKKIFPSTLYLEVRWRRPAARLAFSSGDMYVDAEGFPSRSPDLEPSGLPVIEIPSLVFNSSSPDWRMVKAMSLISALDIMNIRVSRLSVNGQSSEMDVLLDDGANIIMPLNSDIPSLSASLQTIISRFRIEGKFVAKIDFRFDKPVVTLKNE